ncbi:response regulator [Paenibacillus oryzae]|uniref:response regulator n=1 Tax=Paenibacillus oryzae TaxID=1844972 RepID=UPI0009EDE647|nr:response regulator [Paenibacillus oryzae]
MLKVILVDDEEPALIHLERLLQNDGRVQITGKYTSAKEALQHLSPEHADIAFLDIGMPEVNGLEAAELIQEKFPSIRIVYVTAYSAYAVEAFELYALDYLLKPVDADRIRKTIDRVLEYMAMSGKHAERTEAAAAAADVITVRCFKRLELVNGVDSREKVKWRTKKAQELFAYLLHLRGAWVTKERLIEKLWREQEQDKAITYLHHSVSRIRHLLREWGAACTVEYEDESYRLPLGGFQTDVDEFEQIVSGSGGLRLADWNKYEYALSLYHGEYYEDHNYEWAETKRLNLQQSYFQLICSMARLELEENKNQEALQRLLRAQEHFPYSDELCRLVMQCYQKLNHAIMVRESYQTFRDTLMNELGVLPEHHTTELYYKLFSAELQ